MNWKTVSWSSENLAQALELLVLQTGLLSHADQTVESLKLRHVSEGEVTTGWFVESAEKLGISAEAVSSPYVEAEKMIRQAAPAIYRLPPQQPDTEPSYLVTLRGGRRITILCPDLTERKLSARAICTAWCHDVEMAARTPLQPYLNTLKQSTRTQISDRLIRDQLSKTVITGCWLFYANPNQTIQSQLRQHHIFRLSALLLLFNFCVQGLTVAGWSIIGLGTFRGRFDTGWLIAWVLVTFTAVFFQIIMYDMQGSVATSVLRFLKSRILYGAIQLDPDVIRNQGSGQFFGRVLESDVVQNFLVGGVLIVLPFGVMLVMSAVILGLGAGGWIHVGLLIAWTIVALYIGVRRLRFGDQGMQVYRSTTNALVENMLGHRTRLLQESRTKWHENEDKSLALYAERSRAFDWSGVQLDVLIPRGWAVIGLAGIAYPFVTKTASTQALAASLGGILLATQAFTALSSAMKFGSQAIISWRQVAPLLQSADSKTNETTGSQVSFDKGHSADAKQPVIVLRDVTFRYRERGPAILKNCDLTIYKGDRLLLEGPSGGGKSTLAAVIANLRQQESGLRLLWGFDAPTVGSTRWRKRVVTAPQFQENHLFTDTLAFNLLMGRNWPPTPEDLVEAEHVCQRLGLGELIGRMPDGLQQLIGDGGWQLSFGERSRVYIARALLQNADLVILDESFGALDPESLRLAMQCVLEWSPTILVIAHP